MELLLSYLVSLILNRCALTKWLIQNFVDYNRFDKGEVKRGTYRINPMKSKRINA